MYRSTITFVLILLMVLAPTFCQAHSHEAALSNDRDGTAEQTRGPLLPAHFHAHHIWFLDLLDSEHDAQHESDDDDHDSLPGQDIAAVFAGNSIHANGHAEPLQMVSLGFVPEQPLMAVPMSGCQSLPDRYIAASDRPIYLTTLTLRI